MMINSDFPDLHDDAPVFSYNVSYLYHFGSTPVYGSLTMHLDRLLMGFDDKNIKRAIIETAKPSPWTDSNIVILSISPMGEMSKSAFIKFKKEHNL